ncbi:hypothetical protein, partial [Escherichia coli]|uniref:hypothetical protein n=5 Tax=Escherichia coli TaxID=562 RepID=UPI00203B0D9C
MNIDEKIRCSQLLQRIEAVNVERTKVFSRLTVLFCTPDRRSGQEMVLLDVDALRNVCEEFTAANSELLSLVQEYNRIAGSNGFDEIGFAPIFPDTCYHLTHYWLAAVDIPVASDNPVHYADA